MNEKILLVDDEDGIRNVLGIVLEDNGYHVLRAASGEEALSLFRETSPDIVLTDIKMPGMDGIELLRRIKSENPDTEVIMITGHGEMDLAIKSLQSEAADFITKPINDEALELALRRVRERITMKRQLREYTENLERLVEEKTRSLLRAEQLAAVGQTVATIAHSVKNIIGGLTGGIFVLEKGIELRNQEYLGQGWRMLRSNVEKIKNLSLDLLNYARERVPELKWCDPNEPLRDICQLMLPRAEEWGVGIRCEACEDLPRVFMDPEAIHCCLLNLVTNALDACKEASSGDRRLEVVLRSSAADDESVIYEISDNGCGMDEEMKKRVFRGFFSSKGSRGTGLGLMITQKIIHEHEGTIGVESEKGEGTKFTIKIPKVPRGRLMRTHSAV